ncbi:MAG: glycosyltransferase [Acidobacteria bacterium]|nr:glycosyltransferase [Acidobacteriota bacterium]
MFRNPDAAITTPVPVAEGPKADARPSADGKGTHAPADITLILPVYNEADILPGIVRSVAGFVREFPRYRAVFVDDGSDDGTPALLEKAIADLGQPRLECCLLPRNGGKGLAIHAGIDRATGSYVLFTDGDLAYSFDHLHRLADALTRHDVVIGSRRLLRERQVNIRLVRRFTGEVFNRLVRLLLRLPYRDTQAGLKGFTLAAAREIFRRQRTFDFTFDVELIYIARKLGYSVGEIAAHVSETHSYKVSKVRMVRDPLKMFLALFRIWWHGTAGHYAAPKRADSTPKGEKAR